MTDRTGQFGLAFLITGAFALLGAAGWGVLIRRVEPVRWSPLPAG